LPTFSFWPDFKAIISSKSHTFGTINHYFRGLLVCL
jgi:hypothetical protein